MNAVLSIQDNAGAVLVGLFVRAMARLAIGLLWTVLQGALWLCGWWRPVALAAGLAGAVALCLAFPALPIGLGLVALFGWVTYPRSPRAGWGRCNVSWNSEAVR